jgi:4-carboxymuconolactone decarboxylase
MIGMAPRITPLKEQELSDDARSLLALPLKGHQENAVSPFLLTVVRHSGLYRRYAPFAGKLLVAGKLPARDRELAILRCGWLCKAAYEWGEHVRIARAVGITSTEIDRITRGSTDPEWTLQEGAVLRAVEELHSGAHLSDVTWNTLAREYDETQLIELPTLIGAYQMIAYMQNALRVALPEGNAGLDAR